MRINSELEKKASKSLAITLEEQKTNFIWQDVTTDCKWELDRASVTSCLENFNFH